MNNSFVYKTERPWPNKRLKIGAIVGHTGTNDTRLWLRCGKPGDYTLLWFPRAIDNEEEILKGFRQVPYSLAEMPQGVERKNFSIDGWDDDTTVVLDLTDLQADTDYCYALHGRDEERIILGQDRPFLFRTMPGRDVSLSFGFYSCHMPYHKTLFGNTVLDNMDMWDLFKTAIQRHREKGLLFNIAGGDQVYVDGIDTLNLWQYLNKVMRVEEGEILPKEEDMVSWFRDIYRGYWGFNTLQQVFSTVPTYMMWDDHELCDGWGSYMKKEGESTGMESILPAITEKNITYEQAAELIERMFRAGKRVYGEYQHSHNPPTDDGVYDYGYYVADCAFYVLDGRGQRDVNRESYRILGQEQMGRFKAWLESAESRSKSFLFVVSAVPVLHLRPALVNADRSAMAKMMGLGDDLRDSWEHDLHDAEREEMTRLLFDAAKRGQRVCILSGDVHIAAAFKIEHEGSIIYQLTSSAITYNVPRPLQFLLSLGVPDDGVTEEGYIFERLALFTQSNFSIIKVNQEKKEVIFQLYGPQNLNRVEYAGREEIPIPHSVAKLHLTFE